MRVISPTFIGSTAHYLSQMLLKTLRYQMIVHPSIDPMKQNVYGFWHDKQFLPILVFPRWGTAKNAGFVSASRDGQMLCTWLEHLGYHVLRGSSGKKAISGLVKLVGALKEGYSVAIAADGPRGPRHEAKSGITFIAHKSGLHMVPLGVAYARAWEFKSWDKYQLPKPFSKAIIYVGQSLPMENIDNIDEMNRLVAQAITQADENARRILAGHRPLVEEPA